MQCSFTFSGHSFANATYSICTRYNLSSFAVAVRGMVLSVTAYPPISGRQCNPTLFQTLLLFPLLCRVLASGMAQDDGQAATAPVD
jgi:hypothetical protein